MSEIEKMYKERNYSEILNAFLNSVLEKSVNQRKKDFQERFTELIITMYASYMCHSYADTIRLYKKVFSVFQLDDEYWSKNEKINFLKIVFVSALYAHFNADEFTDFSQEEINVDLEWAYNKIKDEHAETILATDDYVKERIKLYENSKLSFTPFYVLKFLYPYEVEFAPYVFDLHNCPPYISLSVNKVERSEDVFTEFEFKITGYTNPDIWWKGVNWFIQERFPTVRKTLPLINLLLLTAAESTPGKFVSPYCVEQVSSVEIYQYDGNKTTPIGACIGTSFDAQWVGGNAPKHIFTLEEKKQINEQLVRHYKARHFYRMHKEAKNNISAGLYVESFMLLCTCAESMLYYWCEHLAELVGKSEEYNVFRSTKNSPCTACKLNSGGSKNTEGYLPSAFGHVDFLNKSCGISKDSCKKLKNLLSKARNESLRNSVVHGITDEVTLKNLEESERALFNMQQVFCELETQILTRTK